MVPFMMLVVSTLYHKHDAISPFPLFFFCHLSISHREERPCLSYFPQGYQRCHFIVIRKACNMYARGIRRKQRITKWGEVPLLLPPAAFEFCGAVDQQGTVGSLGWWSILTLGVHLNRRASEKHQTPQNNESLVRYTMRFMLNVKIDTTLKRSLSLPNRPSQLKSRNQQAIESYWEKWGHSGSWCGQATSSRTKPLGMRTLRGREQRKEGSWSWTVRKRRTKRPKVERMAGRQKQTIVRTQ